MLTKRKYIHTLHYIHNFKYYKHITCTTFFHGIIILCEIKISVQSASKKITWISWIAIVCLRYTLSMLGRTSVQSENFKYPTQKKVCLRY